MLPESLTAERDTGAALLTYCDDATGERTALTAVELGRWAARTAGLLGDGCGLVAGDRAAVLLPPHWQTAAVLLGAWSMGVTVSYRSWATAGLPAVGPGEDEPYDAVFVSRQRLGSWLERVPEARHRFVHGLAPGAASPEVPDGYRDYVAEASRHPGDVPAPQAVRYTDPASPDGTTYRQWGGIAAEIGARLGLAPGDRVLVDAAAHVQPVTWLLAPLAAGASVLLCANLDRDGLERRVATEGVTHVI
ncbi:TIGR03089 family protein [Phytohabitans suffuscus]|uniref:TIGR03089 family protein n=1 Tax=Phytohabitans suffuscus TaxID=624315 RepID=A0A6F8YWR8_9ACTN|nr:TIGR03089 family protein [Phytohabitans suffuscus]BCB90529.1 TIGR03089 family protein [Phytohabitans suffuscus]